MGLKKTVSKYQMPPGFVHDQGYLKTATGKRCSQPQDLGGAIF
jgi:hypothetical protein